MKLWPSKTTMTMSTSSSSSSSSLFSLLIILLLPVITQSAPCPTLLTVSDCNDPANDEECAWCRGIDECVAAMDGCPDVEPGMGGGGGDAGGGADDGELPGPPDGGGERPACPIARTQEDCQGAGNCFWCIDQQSCRPTEASCTVASPPGDFMDGDYDGDMDGVISMPFEAGPMDGEFDGEYDGEFDGAGRPGGSACPVLITQEDCDGSGECFWCVDNEVCRPNENSCDRNPGNDNGRPEDGDGGRPGGGNGDGGRPGDGDGGRPGNGNNLCVRIRNETECTTSEDDCFWCAERELCRNEESHCPGGTGVGGGRRICNAFKNETDCTAAATDADADNMTSTDGDIDCFWCAENNVCRSSEEECPGQGRSNPCRQLQEESECDANTACAWCSELEACTAARGNGICFRNGTMPGEGGGGNNAMMGARACPLLEDEGNCTANVNCRWCENDSMCKRAEAACSDGSAGIRGNPCRDAESEEDCPTGCMWCMERSECRRASSFACLVDELPLFGDGNFTGNFTMDDGEGGNGVNVCRFFDDEVDCNAIDECQWCEAQSRCKLAQANCGQAAGMAGLELDEIGAMFAVQDDGLGTADPDAVMVALDYLFEVAEDGTIIQESLIDFEFQAFGIRQTVGDFFGIAARKITFEGTIEGVGTMFVEVFVMMQAGMIFADTGETWPVQEGDIKFNILMSDWTFCDAENPCGDSALVSEFVDVAVKIQGSNEDPEPSDIDSMLFNLGGNVPLILSDQIVVDDFVQNMPEGFPRAESATGQGTVFVFRFPRFISDLEYDPNIGFHVALIDGDTGETLTEAPVTAPTEDTILVPDTPAPSKLDDSTQAPSATPKKAEDKPADDDGGMSIGALVGIIIGGLLGCCCCCAGVGLAMKKKKDGETAGKDEVGNNATFQDSFEDEGLLGDEENQKRATDGNIVGGEGDPLGESEDDEEEEDSDEDDDDEYESEEEDDDDEEEDDEEEDDDDEEDEEDESEEEDDDDSEYESDDDDDSDEGGVV